MQQFYCRAFCDRSDAQQGSLRNLKFYVEGGLPKLKSTKANRSNDVIQNSPQLYRFKRPTSELIDDITQALDEGLLNSL